MPSHGLAGAGRESDLAETGLVGELSGDRNALVDQRRLAWLLCAGLRLDRGKHRLGCGQFGPASGKLGREGRKLRIEVHAQFLDGFLQPPVGLDLLALAGLDRLQGRKNDVGEQTGEGGEGLIHKEILGTLETERTITPGLPLVTRKENLCAHAASWWL